MIRYIYLLWLEFIIECLANSQNISSDASSWGDKLYAEKSAQIYACFHKYFKLCIKLSQSVGLNASLLAFKILINCFVVIAV